MSTNYIDQITDTAGTTQDISESDSTRIFRATCSTAAGTAAKVATLQTSNKNFSLTAGVRVAVTFTYGNSALNPTLRVDGSSTGTAKAIAVAIGPSTSTTGHGTTYNTWGPYETVIFTYDGDNWIKGASSLGAYIGNPISIAESTNTSQITLSANTKYSLTVGGNSYVFTTPIDGGITSETDPIFSASAASGITSSDITNWNGKTSNTGTVTSVGLSNATNGGLTISGSPVTGSGSITVGHSNVLTNAQTTQAVYPIKIDKNGHISAYGSAVTIPTVPSNIVNTITTTAGTHTAISSKTGTVSFNVPTKTSHLTNDSGYLTGITSAQVTTALGYTPYDSTNPNGYTSNAGTVTGVKINGTTKSPSNGVVDLGTVATSDTNTTYTLSGALSSHKFTSTITAGGSGSGTSTSDFTLAAGTGISITDNTSTRTMTIALSSTIPTITLNGSSTTSPSFYAPTSAGTNGYVLKSNGSGAPSWTSAVLTDTQVTVAENTKATKYYPILASGTGTATRQIDTNDKLNSETASGLYYQNAILGTPGLYIGDIEYTITNSEYSTLDSAIDALL